MIVRRISRLFLDNGPTYLGRWCLTDIKKNNIKVDWANIDHCGTCSYEQMKVEDNKKEKVKERMESKKEPKLK